MIFQSDEVRAMRRQVLIALSASLAAATLPAFGLLAWGQRPRPTRIRFTPGASSSTVNGVLSPGRMERMYVVRASAGQMMTFALSRTNPPVGAVVWDVDPNEVGGAAPIDESVYQPVRTATLTLPTTGDYFIGVSPIGGRALKNPVKFSLTVEIR